MSSSAWSPVISSVDNTRSPASKQGRGLRVQRGKVGHFVIGSVIRLSIALMPQSGTSSIVREDLYE